MQSQVKFGVDKETKLLARRSIERQCSTLSDACSELKETLAREQAEYEDHDA